MYAPDAIKANNFVNNCFEVALIVTAAPFVVVGAVAGGIVLSPIAVAINIFAQIKLRYDRYLLNKDLRFLEEKIIKIIGSAPNPYGPQGKNYFNEAPKRIENKHSGSINYEGNFIFKDVKDLSWLWHEYQRLNVRGMLSQNKADIGFCLSLMIPIYNIYSIFDRYCAKSLGYDDMSDFDHIEKHFLALQWKLFVDEPPNYDRFLNIDLRDSYFPYDSLRFI